MTGKKPQRSTFHKRLDHMIATLRNQIVSGNYAPGEMLPSIAELGEQYGLSKNSVRKGLELLSEEELIMKLPKVGARVLHPVPERQIKIKLGCYKNIAKEAKLDALLQAFHAKYPQIEVQSFLLPYDPYHTTVKEFMDNDWLDVMTMNYSDFKLFSTDTESEYLEELDSFPGTYKFLSKLFTYNERLLAVPWIFSPVILAYNQSHFTQSGLTEPNSSWTWEDLKAAAAKLAADHGGFGFYYHMPSSNRWPIMLLQNGFVNGAENAETEKAKFIASIEQCRDLIVNQSYSPLHFSESNADVEELFARGKASMILCTYYSLNKMQSADVDYDIAPIPRRDTPATLLLTTGLAVNARSRHKHAAKLLVDFLLSEEAQLMIRRQTLSIPSLERAAEWKGVDELHRPSRFHMYREIIPTFKLMTDLGLHHRDIIAIRRELMLFWAGMEEAEAVWERVQRLLELRNPVNK
ncbi:extracellular solute-binding protein [Paenibacillus sp. JSM ZJ436]|uniref:extracellular solute-binding protein n=1 Tax=Paenibacillus sp. JSM ZJ436 TaxID=3376190 RepID=UPI0037A01A20